jgi:hypothetical protein
MDARSISKPIDILLVEDNPGDVQLTIEGLKEGKILNNLSVVSNGVEALALLRREGEYVNAPRPKLILLDLNLPRKDGREVFAEINPVCKISYSLAFASIGRSFFLKLPSSTSSSFTSLLKRLIRYSSLNATDLVNSQDDQTSLTGSLDLV